MSHFQYEFLSVEFFRLLFYVSSANIFSVGISGSVNKMTWLNPLPLLKCFSESTIDSEGFKGGTRGSPIMPRDAVSRTANVGTMGINGLSVQF